MTGWQEMLLIDRPDGGLTVISRPFEGEYPDQARLVYHDEDVQVFFIRESEHPIVAVIPFQRPCSERFFTDAGKVGRAWGAWRKAANNPDEGDWATLTWVAPGPVDRGR